MEFNYKMLHVKAKVASKIQQWKIFGFGILKSKYDLKKTFSDKFWTETVIFTIE